MDVHELPAVNAILNGTAAVLLLRGYLLIRAGRRAQHKNTMIAAFSVSAVFLVSYLVYHANVGAVVGLLPVTGVPLPFVSFGGSSTVIAMAAVGMLANVAKQGR